MQPVVGSKLNLSDVSFLNQPKNLVLALQTGCHFCNKSALFYERLIGGIKDKNVKLVAAFLTEVEKNATHLKELERYNMEVKSSPLNNLQVSITHTLIQTNEKGEIMDYWVRKLTPDSESLNKLLKNKESLMKKLLVKTCILLVLMSGIFYMQRNVQASVNPCDIDAQWDLFQQCDTGIYDAVSQLNDYYAICNAEANRPDPNHPGQTIFDPSVYNDCVLRIDHTYQYRYSTYGDCISGFDGVMYNPNFCTINPDYCPEAVSRAEVCRATFPIDYNAPPAQTFEERSALNSCLSSIPHVSECPGTNYFPE